MSLSVIAPEIIDVPLSQFALAAALWAREATKRTFKQSVEMGYLSEMPALPIITESNLRMAADSLVWEEFDYQLTIGLAELEFPEDHGVSPRAGEKLAHELKIARMNQAYSSKTASM